MVYQSFQEATRNEQQAVGSSSVVLAPARQEIQPRQTILIRNISPNAADVITVFFGNAQAVANNGIVLRQYESLSDSTESEAYKCWQGSITAICATANGLVSIFER